MKDLITFFIYGIALYTDSSQFFFQGIIQGTLLASLKSARFELTHPCPSKGALSKNSARHKLKMNPQYTGEFVI